MATNNLTTEQLLIPRYKVIADYPGCINNLGEILINNTGYVDSLWCTIYDKYPAIFRRLKWWEERAVEDMPEYVKFNRLDNGELKVAKIIKWDSRGASGMAMKPEDTMEWWLCGIGDTPATLEEYQAFKNQQK